MAAPDLVGRAGSAGLWGTIQLYLRIREGRVVEATHFSEGCGYTIACGSILTEWLIGRSIESCRELTPEEFAAGVEGVPHYKAHCPRLAVEALRDALQTGGFL